MLLSAPGASAAPPPNDNFPGPTITVDTAGTNVEATCQAGEPGHDPNWGCVSSVWYTWVAPATANVVVDTCNATFASKLAVYTGSSVNALTLVARNAGSGACPNNRAKTSFRAVN
ncbi:MAG: hypothetical protein M3320_05315, partial [Actinomycetota bacterium]|nr:hypothetical protein [Actinomycetota bacterium]